MIYLDTHVVVWLYSGDIERISDIAKELINGNDLYISPIVQLELQYLFEIQRITEIPHVIISNLFARIGLKVCDQDFLQIITNATSLGWTRDPFDRIIVANAALHQNSLITKDQNILTNYPKAVW